MDMLGKHTTLDKAIKALGDKQLEEISSSGEEENCRRNKNKRNSNSSGSTRPSSVASSSTHAPCFLFGARGHRSYECKVTRDK